MFSNSILVFFIKLLAAVISFLLNMVLVRKLGVQDSGLFFYFQSLVVFLSVIVTFGLQMPIVRCIAQNKIGLYEGIGALKGGLIISSFVSLVFLILSYMFKSIITLKLSFDYNLVVSLILAVFLYSVNVFICSYNQGVGRYIESVLFQTAFSNLITLLCFFLFNPSVNFLIYAYLLSLLIGIFFQLLLFFIINKGFYSKLFKGEFEYGYILSIGFPCFILALFERIVPVIIQYGLNEQSGTEAIAEFSVMIRIVGVITIITSSVNTVVSRKIAIDFKNDKLERIKKTTSQCFIVFLCLSTIFLISIYVFGDYILSLFSGDFTRLNNLLLICAIAQAINMITGSVSFLLIMTGYEKKMRNSVMFGAVISIVYLIITYSGFDIYHATITYFIYIASSNIFAWWSVKVNLGINTLRIYNVARYEKN